jgi:hypothetical protein
MHAGRIPAAYHPKSEDFFVVTPKLTLSNPLLPEIFDLILMG